MEQEGGEEGPAPTEDGPAQLHKLPTRAPKRSNNGGDVNLGAGGRSIGFSSPVAATPRRRQTMSTGSVKHAYSNEYGSGVGRDILLFPLGGAGEVLSRCHCCCCSVPPARGCITFVVWRPPKTEGSPPCASYKREGVFTRELLLYIYCCTYYASLRGCSFSAPAVL